MVNLLPPYITVCFRIDTNSNIKSALCHGLQMSTDPENHYEMLLENYVESSSAVEREAILSAIGCVDDIYVLET